MTIAMAVKVSEGLVLAADSALVLEGEASVPGQPPTKGVLQIYPHATKAAQIRDWPVGTITWGAGLIGKRTIESLVKEFSNTLDDKQEMGVRDIGQGLYDLINDRYFKEFPDAKPALGLQIAGYSPGRFFPEQYRLDFPPTPEGPIVDVRPDNPDGTPNFGANWYGLTDAIVRLHLGFAPEAIEALVKAGVDKPIADKIRGFEYPVIFEAMPLQDAIDFAAWLAEVVVGRFRFVLGPAKVVGPIDIAAITRHDGFTWVRRKTPQVSPQHPFVS